MSQKSSIPTSIPIKFRKGRFSNAQVALLFLASLILFSFTVRPTSASGHFAIEPITWNIIGLDSNNVNTGPEHFPVGARVCNQSGSPLNDVMATFHWEDGNDKYSGDPYINLRPGTLDELSLDIPAGECKDAYFEATVTRNSDAYRKTRSYYITAQEGATTIATPRPRELYVERLISQNRNAVNDMRLSTDGVNFTSIPNGGNMTLMVGQTYFIQLVGKTATQGYEQLESFINFPNTIFQVLSVVSTYSADSSATVNPPYDKLYANGCVWESNPLSPNYRSCLSTGKLGGQITVTYEVKILQVPNAPLVNPEPLGTLVYDFSGASYHYNSDFSATARYATIVNASLGKSFSPKVILPGNNSTLTFTINNPGGTAISDVNFVDNLPAGMSINDTAVTYTNCGTPTPASLTVGQDVLSFSNITVPALSSCTIAVTVTVAADGTYNNQSEPLYIGDENTGSVATDALAASSLPPAPSTCAVSERQELARWEFSTAGSTAPIFQAANVDFANATFSGGTSGVTGGAGAAGYWWGRGWVFGNPTPPPPTANDAHFQLAVDTSNYGGVAIQLRARINVNGNWTGNNNNLRVWHSIDSNPFAIVGTDDADLDNSFVTPAGGYTRSPATTGLTDTRFRIQGYFAHQSQGANAEVWLDDVIITGCPRLEFPTLSKSFSPDTIAEGTDTTLTFTFGNPNSGNLSGISFTDNLPAGLAVADPNGLSVISCSQGSVVTAPTITAVAGSATISMSGLTLSGNSTCNFSVNITGEAGGEYTNISDPITSPSTGPNTGPDGYGEDGLTVVAPPVINKVFGTTNLIVGESTNLTFSIQNPNPTTDLVGVAFTDNLPAGLSVANPNGLTGSCGGGTITAVPNSSSISLSGATLAGGDSCTFSVNVTGNTIGQQVNTVQVTSTNGGDGNESTATMEIRELTPGLTFSKKVSSSPTGPWLDSVIIPPGAEVYYQFTVENTGDVPLTDIVINDPDVNTASCVWPNPLPVANDDGDEIAICIVNITTPLTAGSGQVPNTATVSGTYDNNQYESGEDTATYLNGNFGNLPDIYQYMNLYNDGGAMHLNCLNNAPRLGALVETDATDGTNDPENIWARRSSDDGVVWTPGFNWSTGDVADGAGGSANVTLACPNGDTCYLHGWFDWNQDGAFDGPGEALTFYLSGNPVNSFVGTGAPETYTLRFDIPGGTPFNETNIYARFRIYSDEPANPQPNGLAVDADGEALCGEIEDHAVRITPTAVTLQSIMTALPRNQAALPIVLTALMAVLFSASFILFKRRYA